VDDHQEFALRSVEHLRRAQDERALYRAICIAAQNAPKDIAAVQLEEARRMERAEWPARLRYHRANSIGLRRVRDREIGGLVEASERVLALAREARSKGLVSRALANRADAALTVGDAMLAVRLWRELADEPRLYPTSQPLFVLGNLANGLLQIGEVAEARERLVDFLELARESGWETFDAFSDVPALLAALEARFEAAARLIGFADAANQRLRAGREPNEARARELAHAATRAALAPETFERLMTEGRALDRAAACDLTLQGK
jgi:hypothetical protein